MDTPIGYLPTDGAIDTTGLDIAPEAMKALLSLDLKEWSAELADIEAYFDQFGDRLPPALREHAVRIRRELTQG